MKKYTFTSIIIFVLGILFIIMTFGAMYSNSISQYPDTSDIESAWLFAGLLIGAILIVAVIVRTYRKLED